MVQIFNLKPFFWCLWIEGRTCLAMIWIVGTFSTTVPIQKFYLKKKIKKGRRKSKNCILGCRIVILLVQIWVLERIDYSDHQVGMA